MFNSVRLRSVGAVVLILFVSTGRGLGADEVAGTPATVSPPAAENRESPGGPSGADHQWVSFRNGGPSRMEAPLPLRWSPQQGVSWQRELMGYGQSAPVVFEGRVYVTTVVGSMKDRCCVQCFDLVSGEERWHVQVDASQKAASNFMQSRAAPTPTADEAGVIAFFETGDLVALDHDGRQRWQRSLVREFGELRTNHGLGSSPAQTRNLVVVSVEHQGPSFLLAVSKADGRTVWKAERSSGSSWTSPIVVECNGTQQIVVSSGGTIDGYDAVNGARLWSVPGLAGNSVPSPVATGPWLFSGARVPEFGTQAEAARSNLCIRLDDQLPEKYEVVWRAEKAVADYASPVVVGDCLYLLNNVGVLHCLDATNGEPHYVQRLGIQCWATPIVSADHVYFFGKEGRTKVIRTGATYVEVAASELWDPHDPPLPELWREHHGETSHGGSSVPGQRPGGGMLERLKQHDADQDGRLTRDELPAEFQPMLSRVDTNGDGVVDAGELQAMADSFAKRREGSRQSARDPIVYGAAAVYGRLLIRTGTRLYCVSREVDSAPKDAAAGGPRE